jgi:hypothetical protein
LTRVFASVSCHLFKTLKRQLFLTRELAFSFMVLDWSTCGRSVFVGELYVVRHDLVPNEFEHVQRILRLDEKAKTSCVPLLSEFSPRSVNEMKANAPAFITRTLYSQSESLNAFFPVSMFHFSSICSRRNCRMLSTENRRLPRDWPRRRGLTLLMCPPLWSW